MIGIGWPVYQATDGHLVSLSSPGEIRAMCTCLWSAPDRTGDSLAVAVDLVLDDVAWHCHEIGARCPDHNPLDALSSRCGTCDPLMGDQA